MNYLFEEELSDIFGQLNYEEEELELSPEQEWEEEIKFWGHRSRWPGKI